MILLYHHTLTPFALIIVERPIRHVLPMGVSTMLDTNGYQLDRV